MEIFGKIGGIKSDCKQFVMPIKELRNLPRDKKYSLLDIGASEKYLKNFLPDNISYHSLDYEGDHTYLFNLDSGKLPIKKGAYDIVICLETLEHTLYPSKIMNEILRISKSDALFFLSMPNEYNFYCRLNFLLGIKTEVQETFQITEKHLHIHNPRVKDVLRFFSNYLKIIKIDYQWYSRTGFHDKGFRGKLSLVLDQSISFFSKVYPNLFSRSVIVMGKKKN